MEEYGGKIKKVAEGARILSEGDLDLYMYKIIEGYVEIYMGYGTERETLLGISGPQSCFGEFGMLLEKPAIYTVIAYSDVVLRCISKEDMSDFVRDNNKSVLDIMQNMANTMLMMSSQIDLLIDDIKSGIKPNERTIHEIKKTIGCTAIYRNSAMTGEFHVSDRIRNRRRW